MWGGSPDPRATPGRASSPARGPGCGRGRPPHRNYETGLGVGRQAGNDDLADAFVQAVNPDDLGRAFYMN